MKTGRRAYGAHRQMTPAIQARNIAQSMQAHPGRTLTDYGLTPGEELYELVEQALEQMTQRQAA
jgi:hypothetical protein